MAQRRWSRKPAARAPAREVPQRISSEPVPGGVRLVCALCGREAKGFGYQHRLQSTFPRQRFCSMACCEAGGALARRSGGVIDKTPMEARALKDARRPFAEVLQELGLLAPFATRSAAEIDRVIEACIDGFQASMQRQAAERGPFYNDIPF